jgi:hypothetical protein
MCNYWDDDLGIESNNIIIDIEVREWEIMVK